MATIPIPSKRGLLFSSYLLKPPLERSISTMLLLPTSDWVRSLLMQFYVSEISNCWIQYTVSIIIHCNTPSIFDYTILQYYCRVQFIYHCFLVDLDSIKSAYSSSLFDKSMNSRTRRPLEELIPNAPPDGLDLLELLLQFNPEKRLTAEEALNHPYVAKFHKPADEVSLTYDVVPPVDDDVQLSVNEYRDKLYEVGVQFRFHFNVGFTSH